MDLKNRSLFFGDNLKVLREKFPGDDGYFDLIYLDPPFNSKKSYNVLFKEGLVDSPAQVQAFEDSWHWTVDTRNQFNELVTDTRYPENIANLMLGLEKIIGHNDVLAYLTMMALRLIELYRVLKPTGCLYLHCDPTASHYLKILLDAIFEPERFLNEIIWRRTGSHNTTRSFGPIHDVILVYSKSENYKFNIVRRPYMKGHVETRYKETSDGKLAFSSGGNVLTGAGATEGESGMVWRGFDPSASNRHWAVPTYYEPFMPEEYKTFSVLQKLEALYLAGHIEIKPGVKWPIMVRYLDERDGVPIQDIWAYQPYTEGTVWETNGGIDEDVAWLGPTDPERLGYATQKPTGLLERIIKASSDEGDWVLDPFGGCGSTAAAAEKLKRNWVIIDVTTLSISLVKRRIQDMYKELKVEMFVDGLPGDLSGAKALFEADPFEFEYWCCDIINARPAGDKKKGKMKGADKGIDGVITFPDQKPGSSQIEYRKLLVQVKGGHVAANHIRDFWGTIEREKAAGGVFITLEKPTKPMIKDAVEAGEYIYNLTLQKYPKIQIITVEELLSGKLPQHPSAITYAKKAEKAETQQGGLFYSA